MSQAYPPISIGLPAAGRFTGKERDNETGYDYFGARYGVYPVCGNSRIARWLQVDPLADKIKYLKYLTL
ncbi:MAG: hypothetical protein R6W90_04335 [Ignavibacteriaceae bacterium]